MNPAEAWEATLGELQLQMTRATFDTWLKDARFLAREDDLFFISVPSAYA
ncbi:MAG: chromosomal replication initiator protein DnaA, partial [Anaerolineales bacterium]|nr:chromosomal replication initiator protein DnaA [Anaerolineales bacterium]